MSLRLNFCALVIMLICSCQSTQHLPNTSQAVSTSASLDSKLGVRFLTEEEAVARAIRVSEIRYQLKVDLTGDSKNFKGDMHITFRLSDAASDLKLDSTESKIMNLMINGQEVKTFTTQNRAVLLPQKFLKKGMNEVSIAYLGVYSHSGEGLHRFTDPVDNREYLYTQFEDFDANRFMPCFDQPDLKAKLQLEVLAPLKWQVITATLETKQIENATGARLWSFPETQLISTYLFSLHAGEFKVWSSKFGKIPLRLFARQSLAKFVQPNEWFKTTKQGLKFYQNYFAIDYPFAKYDQLIVPEFNAGAMENVGAVTFSERMIYRGKQTRNQRSDSVETILHEMAHMWFGDLVTMKWWNDLWLNESFADFMESQATREATEFKDAELDAFSGERQWAYHDDELVTTHPIEAKVRNTDEAFLNFDGITYGKGAAVFKQLQYTIGAETFRQGVRNYFQKYSYKNTELKDFIGELAGASHQDLMSWSKGWLQDSGVDTLKVQIKCEAQKIQSLNLEIQKSSTSNQNRSHAFEIALLSGEQAMKVTDTLRVVMNGSNLEVKDAVGKNCPKLIYPNYRNNDYIKFELDPITLKNISSSFRKVEDPFLRLMFVTTLWQMVRDQKLKLAEYSDLALAAVAVEKERHVRAQLIRSISGGRHADEDCLYFYMPDEAGSDRELRKNFVERVEKTYAHNLQQSASGSDDQTIWLDALIHSTESQAGLANLKEILSKNKITGLSVDQDRRWAIVQRFCEFGDPGALKMLENEEKLDASNRAKDSRLACMASLPNSDDKKNWYSQVKAEKSEYSLEQIKAVSSHIFPYQQRELQKPFADDFFKFMSQSFSRDQEYLVAVTGELAPRMCSRTSADRLQAFVSSNPAMPAVLLKTLKVAGQEDERCAKVRAFNEMK